MTKVFVLIWLSGVKMTAEPILYFETAARCAEVAEKMMAYVRRSMSSDDRFSRAWCVESLMPPSPPPKSP
jgi:hypothetical protein